VSHAERSERIGAAVIAAALALCCWAPAHTQAAPATPSLAKAHAAEALGQASDAISELRLDEAERLLAELSASHAEAPEVLFEQARFAFYVGQYARAVGLADRALQGASSHERKPWQAMRDLMAATEQVTQPFERAASPDGRYVVFYPPGKDAVLAEYALEILGKADRALQEAFSLPLPAPLRIEIYASPETLARVSALTAEQIKTTGTVALSKFNRLMITSPKALVRGYPWADTITHELVHLVVSRLTGDHAPVWLQEGIAKLFERSWRGQGQQLQLDASARGLLQSAQTKGKLLTFEQMHPSIAMLPSEDDAALAFAEVATFMQLYVQRYGLAALRAALLQIERGVDAREALAKAANVASFARLEADWKAGLPAKSDAPSPRRLKPRFKVGEGPSDESSEVAEGEARRYLRLGDLLWDRGRAAAASREYERAHRADPKDPIVAARFGRAALQAGDAQAAIDALAPEVDRYPGHAPTQALLGAAHLQLGQREAARAALEEAIWINPFDPDPHCNLARAVEDVTRAKREQAACEALR
jgi:tetratricopeptide (TPR) repeat protein